MEMTNLLKSTVLESWSNPLCLAGYSLSQQSFECVTEFNRHASVQFFLVESSSAASKLLKLYMLCSGASIFKTLIPESITLGHHGVTHLKAFTVFLFSNFCHLPFIPKALFYP